MELKAEEIFVGGRYRGRRPYVVHTMHRDLWDDRLVTWLSPDLKMVSYDYHISVGSVATGACTMKLFLAWVGRQLLDEEGSDVKPSK